MFYLFLERLYSFLGFFEHFFDSSLSPVVELGQQINIGISAVRPFDVPLLNTRVLLSRGATLTWAHQELLNNKDIFIPHISTVCLGSLFIFLQGFEYRVAPFSLSEGIFGTTFFVSTGFHGLHVIIGTVFMFVVLLRLLRRTRRAWHHVSFELMAWYWHFVDVVWLFLYIFVYYWNFYFLSLNKTLYFGYKNYWIVVFINF